MSRGIFDRILDAVGLEKEEYELEEDEMVMDEEDEIYFEDELDEQEEDTRAVRRRQAKITPLPTSTSKLKMLVFQPSSYEEAECIIDNLKARKPVIMNLDELELELGQRILDFVGGAVYSLNGDIKKVARSIFVVAPSNVDVAQNIETGAREGFYR